MRKRRSLQSDLRFFYALRGIFYDDRDVEICLDFSGRFLLGMLFVLFQDIWQHKSRVHVLTMIASYAILTLVDVYTIIFENYPVLAPKSLVMLFAFFLGDVALLFFTNPKKWRNGK